MPLIFITFKEKLLHLGKKTASGCVTGLGGLFAQK